MPPRRKDKRLAGLTYQQRKFVRKHWQKLVRLHPEYKDPSWTEEERCWWTSYYQTDPSRLDEWSSCQEYLPPEPKDAKSKELPPDEVLIRAEEALDLGGRSEDACDSLADAFLGRAIEEYNQIVHGERAAGNLTRTQETALRWIALLISKPTTGQDLESALSYGRFNINALVVQINRRAHKKIVSHRTLAKAIDILLQSIRSRTGKSGYIGSYQTKPAPKLDRVGGVQ